MPRKTAVDLTDYSNKDVKETKPVAKEVKPSAKEAKTGSEQEYDRAKAEMGKKSLAEQVANKGSSNK